jgi:hypothetical protein
MDVVCPLPACSAPVGTRCFPLSKTLPNHPARVRLAQQANPEHVEGQLPMWGKA